MDRTCQKCGRVFGLPCRLQVHLKRKTPCDPIIDTGPSAPKFACRFCGRAFTTAQAVSRHTNHRCKIANSDEGMGKLMEHTIQRQIAEQNTKIDRLATLLEQQLAVGAPLPNWAPATYVARAQQVNTGAVTNVQNVIHVAPWDGERRIDVSVSQIAAAFAENARLQEYARLGDHELTDPEIAPPYVTELFMDLTKRAHADPATRNVYLNPRRADQALVHLTSGQWEVLPLVEATRLILDGVAASIHKVARTYAEMRQLPLEAQNALSMAGLLYDDEPNEYARRAKAPMAAHLANTAPQICQ